MKYTLFIIIISSILCQTYAYDMKYSIIKHEWLKSINTYIAKDTVDNYYEGVNWYPRTAKTSVSLQTTDLAGMVYLSDTYILETTFKVSTIIPSCIFSMERKGKQKLALCLEPAGEDAVTITLNSANIPDGKLSFGHKIFKGQGTNLILSVNKTSVTQLVNCEVIEVKQLKTKISKSLHLTDDMDLSLVFPLTDGQSCKMTTWNLDLYSLVDFTTLPSLCPHGPIGAIGLAGVSGMDGINGTCKCSKDIVASLLKSMPEMKGPRGETGLPGADGIPGLNGADGYDGNNGTKGERGDRGEVGQGGPPGRPGTNGMDGVEGKKGEKGESGNPALLTSIFDKSNQIYLDELIKLLKGNKGEKGFQGFKGEDGKPGENGQCGPKGDNGERGSNGIKGEPGSPVSIDEQDVLKTLLARMKLLEDDALEKTKQMKYHTKLITECTGRLANTEQNIESLKNVLVSQALL